MLETGQFRFAKQLAQGGTTGDVLAALSETIEQESGGTLVSILILDEDGRRLGHGAAPSLPHEYNLAIDGIEIGDGAGSCGTAAYRGERVIVDDIETDPLWKDYRDLAATHGLRACWSQPIRSSAGGILGTFALYFREKRRPTPAELDLIEEASSLASVVIERTRAEDALRRSEERFRDYAEATSDWFWETDADGRFTNLSDNCFDILDMSPEEIIGKSHSEIPQGASSEDWDEHTETLKARRPHKNFVFTRRLRDGTTAWLSSSGKPYFDSDGKFLGYRGATTDITARVTAEHALADSEERYRTLVDLSPDAIGVSDGERLLFANPAYVAMHGAKSSEELIGMKWVDLIHPDDRAAANRRAKLMIERRMTEATSVRRKRLRVDGSELVTETTVAPIMWGNKPALLGVMHDITQQHQAEQALRKSEDRYELAVRGSNAGLWDWNIETDEDYFSPRWKELLGYDEDELEPHVDTFFELLHPDDRDRAQRAVEAHFEERIPYDLEFRLRYKDGRYVWVHAAGQAVWNEHGEPIRMAGSITDITDQKRAEQALSDSETRYRQLAELSPDGMFVHVDGEVVFANASLARILAVPSPEDLLGKQAFELIAPEHHARALQRRKKLMRREVLELEVSEVVRFDGSRVPIERTGTLVSWDNTPAVLVLVRDISEREAAAKELRESEERFRGVVENLPTSLSLKDLEGRYQFINPKFTEWFGLQPEDVTGQTMHDVFPNFPNQIPDVDVSLDRKVMETGRTHEIDRDVPFPDGTLHSLALTKFPVLGPDNKIVGIGTINSDVTERKQAEKALVESRDQLRLITDNLPVLIAYIDAEQRYRFVNKTGTEWFARPVEEIVGRTVPEILGQESEKIRSRVDKALAGGQQTVNEIITYPDGVTRTVRATHVPHFGAAGGVEGYFILAEDISELQQAEQALRQAQKMEAVGQLTGGVAHDFNNLLCVILGNAERLRSLLGDDEKARHHVEEVVSAVDRSASLTQRLLSFSRQQTLLPTATDVADLISGLEDMLQRTLGETIELTVAPGRDVWTATIDAHQFENALLNLAINSRDAMAKGGGLTIATGNVALDAAEAEKYGDVAPGDYVKVTVSDTGSGIKPEVLDKVFEPFFTTKGVGEGSGLGLSMVYGFAKQSKGHITISSEVGHGTTIELYLPRSHEAVDQADTKGETPEFAPRADRILVVEDDEVLRNIPVGIFQDQGFEIVEAKDGAEAIKHLQEGEAFDLLFTDVVLPGGMNGVEIAEEAQRLQPDIKVLFTTGYAQSAIAENGAGGGAVHMINKPYRSSDLLVKVTNLLDGKAN